MGANQSKSSSDTTSNRAIIKRFSSSPNISFQSKKKGKSEEEYILIGPEECADNVVFSKMEDIELNDSSHHEFSSRDGSGDEREGIMDEKESILSEPMNEDDLFCIESDTYEDWSDNMNKARKMILNVIKESEIQHLTTLVDGYNRKKSVDKMKGNTKKLGRKKSKSDEKIQYVTIARTIIAEKDIVIQPSQTAREVAEYLYYTAGFCVYGVAVRQWSMYVKATLNKFYKPDDYWNMLCFFTDKFKRHPDSAIALDKWHPFQNRKFWELNVPTVHGREDIKELYGIIGINIRQIIVARPDVYLETIPPCYRIPKNRKGDKNVAKYFI